MRFSIVSLLCLALVACAPTDVPERGASAEVDLARSFPGVDGTFVLLDGQTGAVVRHNPERARTRLLPASTFKIPNSLIALETGVATGPDFPLAWDSLRAPRENWWPAAWAQDQTFRTALANSVVWYYQELARRIGAERMQAYLERFDYGNGDLSSGIDQFWLQGDFGISADEQIGFLRRFYTGALPVSARSLEIVKEILVLETTPEYRLSGKTGTVTLPGGTELGWLVGYVEREGQVHLYALNLEADAEVAWDRDRRVRVAKEILRTLGVLPPGDG